MITSNISGLRGTAVQVNQSFLTSRVSAPAPAPVSPVLPPRVGVVVSGTASIPAPVAPVVSTPRAPLPALPAPTPAPVPVSTPRSGAVLANQNFLLSRVVTPSTGQIVNTGNVVSSAPSGAPGSVSLPPIVSFGFSGAGAPALDVGGTSIAGIWLLLGAAALVIFALGRG
jgi:hypothetical protein